MLCSDPAKSVMFVLESPAARASCGRLRASVPDGPLTFFVHTHVREDTFQLFGFLSAQERQVFRLLLGVSTVGPRIALAVLSSLPAAELSRVIARRELARLTAISGIGKKIAERLLLELRDKLPLTEGAPPRAPRQGALAASPPPSPDTRDRLISALTNSGYKPAEAERAAEQLGERLEELPLPELIREALRMLAK